MHENQARLLAAVLASALPGGDDAPVFDEELCRLPEKDRAALVLYYFQGRTGEEAARALRWPVGRFKRRVAAARRHFRARLALRGVPTTAAGLRAFLLSAQARAGSVPAPLIEGTVRAAVGPTAAEPQAAPDT